MKKEKENHKILYGMITGKSDTLLNLPLALNVVYATSLVPNVSKAFALKKYDDAARKISFSITEIGYIDDEENLFLCGISDVPQQYWNR